MVTYMNDKRIQTLDDVRVFLEGTAGIEFSIENKGERYRWIQAALVRFEYSSLGRTDVPRKAVMTPAGQFPAALRDDGIHQEKLQGS